ncbi:MAG: hypothetical protein AAGI69_24190 [Cyanobacteria bacterium P01_H01_bin.21]
MTKHFHQWGIYGIFTTGLMATVLVLLVDVRLVIANYRFPNPQAILVLGGGNVREPVAAEIVAQNATLEVWVSSGLLLPQANQIFLAEQVSLDRVHLITVLPTQLLISQPL